MLYVLRCSVWAIRHIFLMEIFYSFNMTANSWRYPQVVQLNGYVKQDGLTGLLLTKPNRSKRNSSALEYDWVWAESVSHIIKYSSQFTMAKRFLVLFPGDSLFCLLVTPFLSRLLIITFYKDYTVTFSLGKSNNFFLFQLLTLLGFDH